MRLADLIGALVLDPEERRVGRVSDVRLVDEGPAGLRVDGLVVSPRLRGQLLAYDHRPVERPWLLAYFARRGSARALWVPWDDVAGVRPDERTGEPGTVRLTRGAGELGPLAEAYRSWS
ncbi:hypothetical protein [Actinomadura macrotermitis]|uniref:PRC-barrel domain containing protein n=1 Tax=Actinomadura macrotermitis TaxID=2585200 RepID=A0A7K0BU15_9ACTN|nr:hypothetical protein [Actinomadura macrotermitis]MQY04685.1 hypothetical protein [Actinomadura macrotermitis]